MYISKSSGWLSRQLCSGPSPVSETAPAERPAAPDHVPVRVSLRLQGGQLSGRIPAAHGREDVVTAWVHIWFCPQAACHLEHRPVCLNVSFPV